MKALVFYKGWGKDDHYQEYTTALVNNQEDIDKFFEEMDYETGDLYRWIDDKEDTSTLSFDDETPYIVRFNCSYLDSDYPAYYGFKLLSEAEYKRKLKKKIEEQEEALYLLERHLKDMEEQNETK